MIPNSILILNGCTFTTIETLLFPVVWCKHCKSLDTLDKVGVLAPTFNLQLGDVCEFTNSQKSIQAKYLSELWPNLAYVSNNVAAALTGVF